MEIIIFKILPLLLGNVVSLSLPIHIFPFDLAPLEACGRGISVSRRPLGNVNEDGEDGDGEEDEEVEQGGGDDDDDDGRKMIHLHMNFFYHPE